MSEKRKKKACGINANEEQTQNVLMVRTRLAIETYTGTTRTEE